MISIRLLLILIVAAALFFIADRHKSVIVKGGNTFFAILLLSINMIAEMKQISAVTSQLHLEKIALYFKDFFSFFSFSNSAFISVQLFVLAVVSALMFASNCEKRTFDVILMDEGNLSDTDNSKYVARMAIPCSMPTQTFCVSTRMLI